MDVEIGAASRAKGLVNEDAFLVDAEHQLFGVFDGLGSTSQSAWAARLAAVGLRAAYHARGRGHDDGSERAFLPLAVRGAGVLMAAILEDGLTTASLVKLCESGGSRATALICNVGDSRVYRYTAAGELVQCTLDDSPFGADWDLQLRLGDVVVPTDFIEHAYFAGRHVMGAALGERITMPHMWEVAVEHGDVLLALTDGITDNLTFSELRRLVHGVPEDPARLARRLVHAAYARSRDAAHARAKVDDITAVAARVRIT